MHSKGYCSCPVCMCVCVQSHVFGIGVVASPEVDLLAAVTSLSVSKREPFRLLKRSLGYMLS